MNLTPEQLREHAKQWDDDGRYSIGEVFRAHAAALEEVERFKEKMAIDAVQYDALLAERDRERKEHVQWVRDHQADTDAAHRAKQRAESALADAERKIERLKFHAEAMAQAGAFRSFDEQAEAYYRYRAEFKE